MYRIGICDDDKVFCARTEEMIMALSDELPEKTETEVWYSGESVMRDFSGDFSPDILFLDIELYEKSGIDVGKFIRDDREDYRMHIVFVSAKQEYAMQLFRIQPLDFLIKPVSKEKLKEVLLRSMKQKTKNRTMFEYQKGGGFYQVPFDEIMYFRSDDKKIQIVMKAETQEFYGKLKRIMDILPSGFIKIHQSYIVNSEFVREYTYETVKMKNGDLLNISKPYRKEVRSRIRKYEEERWHVGKF